MKLGLGVFIFFSSLSSPAAEAPDKSQFWLFNPTPRPLMREMSTDRPDQTESAYTVDAGHFQIESDLFSYTHDSDQGGELDAFSAISLNLKVGLLNNVDLQLGLNPFLYDRFHDSGGTFSSSGIGDLVTRLKINLWGNDSGPFALAMMPFLKIPTGDHLSNGSLEGGVIFPLAFELPNGWGMGLMTEFDFLRNDDDDGYHTEFVNSITFAHDIVGSLAGYVEFFTVVSTQSNSDWQGFFDFGLTYAVTDDLQLDTGINIGVTSSAPDWNPFIGLSYRY